jgi:hypothetical protein
MLLWVLGCLATKTHVLSRDVDKARPVWGEPLGAPVCTLATAFPAELGEGPLKTEVLLELEQTWQGESRVPIERYRQDELVDPGWVVTGIGGLGMALVAGGTFGVAVDDLGDQPEWLDHRWIGGGVLAAGAGTLAWAWSTHRRVGKTSEPYNVVEDTRLEGEISEVRPGAWILLELRDNHGVLARGETDQDGRLLIPIERSASQEIGVWLEGASAPFCKVDLHGTPAVSELDSAEIIALVEQGRLDEARLALELSSYARGGWEAWCKAAGPALLQQVGEGEPRAAAALLHGPENHCRRLRARATRAWSDQLDRALSEADAQAASAWIAAGPRLDPDSPYMTRAGMLALRNMGNSVEELDTASAREWLRIADLLSPLDIEAQHGFDLAIEATVPRSWQPRLEDAALACRTWAAEVHRRQELFEAAEAQGPEALELEQTAFDDWLYEQETGPLGAALRESRAIQEEMLAYGAEQGEDMDARLIDVAATMKAACP